MKYLKLLALCLLPISFAACSDDEEMNSGNATVGFASTELSVTENTSMVEIPISLEGDHTGPVKVNIEVTDCNGASVTNDETIILTSNSLIMPSGVETVQAELRSSVYTVEDNLDRSFTVKITSAEGATIGNATCKVNIEEIPDPYTNLAGNWTLSAGRAGNLAIVLNTREDRSGYDCTMTLQGVEMPFTIAYTPQGLTVKMNTVLAKGLDFGDPVGVADAVLAYIDGNYLVTDPLSAAWNEDLNLILFDYPMTAALFSSATGQFTGYTWFTADTVMRKVETTK